MTLHKVTTLYTKLNENAKMPSRQNVTDAGFDLCCIEDISITVNEITIVKTGIAVAIPLGFVGMLVPRSGLAANHGITIVNSPGIIDSGYRGELMVIMTKLTNFPSSRVSFAAGDRIAQLIIVPCNTAMLWAKDLPESDRGNKGFGSTGV